MKTLENIEPKMLLSALWIFVTLNYLYCDLIGLMDSNMLNQYATGTVEGLEINEQFLVMAAMLMEIPIAMTLLSRILNYKANRLTNIVAAGIKTIAMLVTLFIGTATLYYWFFACIEIATTVFILGFAWQWKIPHISSNSNE